MTEDEACELLVTNRAHWMWGQGWRIVTHHTDYGDNVRNASSEECQVLDKVKATVMGSPDSMDVAY